MWPPGNYWGASHGILEGKVPPPLVPDWTVGGNIWRFMSTVNRWLAEGKSQSDKIVPAPLELNLVDSADWLRRQGKCALIGWTEAAVKSDFITAAVKLYYINIIKRTIIIIFLSLFIYLCSPFSIYLYLFLSLCCCNTRISTPLGINEGFSYLHMLYSE